MKLTPFSIFIVILSILAIALILTRLRKDAIGIRSATIWIMLWFGIGFFGLFPALLNTGMHVAQMGNRMIFVLVIAVFILRDIEGMSTAETAEILSISISSAKVQLHRARLMLREQLSAYFSERLLHFGKQGKSLPEGAIK